VSTIILVLKQERRLQEFVQMIHPDRKHLRRGRLARLGWVQQGRKGSGKERWNRIKYLKKLKGKSV